MNFFQFYFKKKQPPPKNIPNVVTTTNVTTPTTRTPSKNKTEERLIQNLKKLPMELVCNILSYTYKPQNQRLLKDIHNFYLTKQVLLEKVCNNNPSILTETILFYYCYLYIQKNSNPYVLKKIAKWRNKNKIVNKLFSNIVIIEMPNELQLFEHETKWVFLWGILEPEIRNIYLNYLYSVFVNHIHGENPLPPIQPDIIISVHI